MHTIKAQLGEWQKHNSVTVAAKNPETPEKREERSLPACQSSDPPRSDDSALESGTFSVGMTPVRVRSEPAKTAVNGTAVTARNHSYVTADKPPVPTLPPLIRPLKKTEPVDPEPIGQVIARVIETVRVRRQELVELKAKLLEQVTAIDVALGMIPEPPTVVEPARRSVVNSSAVKALREGRLTVKQIAKKAGMLEASARGTMASAIKEGLVVKEGWGSRAHYRLADLGDEQ